MFTPKCFTETSVLGTQVMYSTLSSRDQLSIQAPSYCSVDSNHIPLSHRRTIQNMLTILQEGIKTLMRRDLMSILVGLIILQHFVTAAVVVKVLWKWSWVENVWMCVPSVFVVVNYCRFQSCGNLERQQPVGKTHIIHLWKHERQPHYNCRGCGWVMQVMFQVNPSLFVGIFAARFGL